MKVVRFALAPLHGSKPIRPGNLIVRHFHGHGCMGSSIPGPGLYGSGQSEVAADLGRRIQKDAMIVDVR